MSRRQDELDSLAATISRVWGMPVAIFGVEHVHARQGHAPTPCDTVGGTAGLEARHAPSLALHLVTTAVDALEAEACACEQCAARIVHLRTAALALSDASGWPRMRKAHHDA